MAKQPNFPQPRFHVLLLAGDPDAREQLRNLLEQGRCHVTACADGRSAWQAGLKAGRSYDAVVVDLPSLTEGGVAALERLRATTGGSEATVVGVDGEPILGVERHVKAAGLLAALDELALDSAAS
jgi:CheY-like chemotaxis protein